MLFPKPSRPLQGRWGEGEERQGGPWEAGVACVTGPFGAAGWGGDKTVVNKRSGRTRKTGENGTDKGDACRTDPGRTDHRAYPQGSWVPSPASTVWPAGLGISLPPSRPHANSSCALLHLRLGRIQQLAEAQTHQLWVASQNCSFFISLD